jgi:hypothetical protein
VGGGGGSKSPCTTPLLGSSSSSTSGAQVFGDDGDKSRGMGCCGGGDSGDGETVVAERQQWGRDARGVECDRDTAVVVAVAVLCW